MKKKEEAITLMIKEDIAYGNLEEEEKKAIREEAIEELRKTNPQFENKRLEYMKDFLITMKIREIVSGRYCPESMPANVSELKKKDTLKKFKEMCFGRGGGNDAA